MSLPMPPLARKRPVTIASLEVMFKFQALNERAPTMKLSLTIVAGLGRVNSSAVEIGRGGGRASTRAGVGVGSGVAVGKGVGNGVAVGTPSAARLGCGCCPFDSGDV